MAEQRRRMAAEGRGLEPEAKPRPTGRPHERAATMAEKWRRMAAKETCQVAA